MAKPPTRISYYVSRLLARVHSDCPIRFDRKYYFNLPAAMERQAFIEAKNESLQPEMRLSKEGIIVVVELTEGFSFAYLKELFLSSMMEWMDGMKSGGMDEAMTSRAAVLRGQMTFALAEPSIPPDEDNDE